MESKVKFVHKNVSQVVCLMHCFFSFPFHFYSSILGETGVMATQTVVTEVAPSPDVVWVGTTGGHLLAFHPVTMDVLLVQRRQLSINSIVCLGRERLAVFGEGVIGEGSEHGGTWVVEDKDSICGLFTIWTSYIGID